MSDRPLDGQVALVTGAGSADGIGLACATALGALGARVMLVSTTDRIQQRARELCEAGIPAEGEAGDLSDAGFVGRIVDRLAARQGRLDICVNNAGMAALGRLDASAPIHALRQEDWETGIRRNAVAPGWIATASSTAAEDARPRWPRRSRFWRRRERRT